MVNSEFPETRMTRIGRKVGWIFSPLLLLALIAFTLFIAEGLKLDLDKRSVEKKASIEVKDVKNATVFLDGKEVGKTPNVFDTTSEKQVEIKVRKDGRKEWNKVVKPRPGYVKTYYPILYPEDINLKAEQISVDETYLSKSPLLFFYQKHTDDRIIIYKYSVAKQIFGSKVQNVPFADITSLVGKDKKFNILPGNTGKSILLVIYNEKAVVLDDRGTIIELPNIIPKEEDKFYWSPNDTYLTQKTGEEIYSINTSNNRVLLLYRPNSTEEKSDIQFLLDISVVYTVKNPSFTDLVQTTYEGGNTQKIELPNIDNIRKDNFVKAYDLVQSSNLILIQTKENIFSYNVVTFDLKKFNLYKNEKVVYIDAENQKVLTINEKNYSQFIFTDIEQDERKTFTLNNPDPESPKNVVGYNGGQNLILEYSNKIVLLDEDGANLLSFNALNAPQTVLALRQDNNVHIIIKENSPQEIQSAEKYTLDIEKFEN